MSLHFGDTAPDFTADSSTRPIRFHDWIGSKWVFFFSHPGDFTPVCTTEIGRSARLAGGFAERNVKPLGLSTDTVSEHLAWIKDVNATQHTTVGLKKTARARGSISAGSTLTALIAYSVTQRACCAGSMPTAVCTSWLTGRSRRAMVLARRRYGQWSARPRRPSNSGKRWSGAPLAASSAASAVTGSDC